MTRTPPPQVTTRLLGNILSLTTRGLQLNTPTNAGTNRLTGGLYDFSGSLTNWNGNSYAFDPFHNIWDYTPSGGGSEWIYLYTADDERVWSYRTNATAIWTLRDLGGKVLREYNNASSGPSIPTTSTPRRPDARR